ncbi:MAG TPA: DNA-binding response regulator [Lachnospiraceae bacterium]|jgi:DNA-binding response OmpR family regulator|nr:DNA-binding response regulator [Lachnospiraceae bacterium]HBZ03421.1 DNA-binding response regulator [Lachnospiraceae bacterium]
MKVFIVEDDPIIVEGLTIALSQEGYDVASFGNVTDAIKEIESEAHYDVCLLDVNLPDGDGFQVCKAIRSRSEVPVIFLTACDDEIHTVLAFEQGADDYIAKPFRIRELIARIKAILRRTRSDQGKEVINVGGNTVDIMSGKVFRNGEEIFLSAVEYRLLLTFVKSRGQLLTRQQILTAMWDSAGDFVNDNTLTVYVRRLRKKLEEPGDKPVIVTVRGVGYRME